MKEKKLYRKWRDWEGARKEEDWVGWKKQTSLSWRFWLFSKCISTIAFWCLIIFFSEMSVNSISLKRENSLNVANCHQSNSQQDISPPLGYLLSKKWEIASINKDVENLELLSTVGGSVKWSKYSGKQYGSFSKKNRQ